MQKPNQKPNEYRAKMLLKNMGQMMGDTKNMGPDKMKKMVMAGRMAGRRG